jgi:L-ascorbate metabolism protein UlaG (beta-lactamase superfamily)
MWDAFGGTPSGARLERMRRSPRFADGRFHNTHPVPTGLDPAARSPLRELVQGRQKRSPPGPLPALDPRAAWASAAPSGLRATWLGHSTTLLEVDGFRILTDPVWGKRCSPFRHLGPARFQPVPVALDELPALDLVAVSHDHYDHLDFATMRALAKGSVPIVAPLGVGAHLEAWGIAPARIHELDWWEELTVRGAGSAALTVTSTPAQHFSGRGLRSRFSTLWTSYAFVGPRHRAFFSGDTGLTDEFAAVARRAGPFDLTLLEVGAHHPSWGHIHLGPENAVKAFRMLGGGTLLPIHWGTFNLALHAWDDPPEQLLRRQADLGGRLLMPRLGQAVEPSAAGEPLPWWREAAAAPSALSPRPASAGEVRPWTR